MPASAGDAHALTIRDLRKRFGRSEVLPGVSLSVPRGSLYGFVGLNGAGKTTTIECALGLLPYEDGEISVLGLQPREIHRARGRVGAAFDTPGLHPALTVRENLEQAAIFSGRSGRGPAELEALLGLGPSRRRRARQLSLGNRRRLSIALALLGKPELVILDEPFSGLDALGVEEVLALMRRLSLEEGTTLLFSSHQLELVERIATHVAIIHQGRIRREGALEEILAPGEITLEIAGEPLDRAREILEASGACRSVRFAGGDRLLASLLPSPEAPRPRAAALNALLVRSGIAVAELALSRPTLGAYFRELTGIAPPPEAGP